MNLFSSHLQNQLLNRASSFLAILLCIFITTTIYAQPEIDNIEISSTAPSSDYYKEGDTIAIKVNFTNGTIAVETNTTPSLSMRVGNGTKSLNYDSSATTSSKIVFSYIVEDGVEDTDGISIPRNSLRGRINDLTDSNVQANLNHDEKVFPSHKVDAVKPTISQIEITSDSGTDNTYITGDEIEFTVTFSESIVIDDNDHPPSFRFQLGSDTRNYDANRTARYDATKTKTAISNLPPNVNNVLVFSYQISQGDEALNGLAYKDDTIQDSVNIQDMAGNDCECTTRSQRPHSQHKVKTSKPQLESLKIDSTPIHYSGYLAQDNSALKDTYYRGEYILFEATFNEDVMVEGKPAIKFNIKNTNAERTAVYSPEHDDDGDNKTITFVYEIETEDLGIAGIRIPDMDPIFSLTTQSQTEVESVITDIYGNPSILSLPPNQPVDTENLLQTQNRGKNQSGHIEWMVYGSDSNRIRFTLIP